jgi:hypothetical protein
MWEGDALSPGAMAQAPPEDAITLAGGTSMDDGNEGGADPNAAAPPAAPPAAAPPAEQTSDIEKMKIEMNELRAQYEAEKKANAALLNSEKLEKDELLKAKAELELRNKTAEDRERKVLVNKIEKFDKDYPHKDGDIETMRRDLYFFEKVSKKFEDVRVSGADFVERDSLGLEDMDKLFEEGKGLEKQVFNRTEFNRPPSNVFTSGDK